MINGDYEESFLRMEHFIIRICDFTQARSLIKSASQAHNNEILITKAK